jgi:hypothetical protein
VVLRGLRTTSVPALPMSHRAMRRHAGIAIFTRYAAFNRSMMARAPR